MPGILRIIDTSNSTPIPPYATGRVNKNRLPAAGSLSTQSWPPCAPMNSRAMLSPSPELPPGAVRDSKTLMRSARAKLTAETIAAEGEVFGKRLRSPEAQEAFSAFFQKRKPDFAQFS